MDNLNNDNLDSLLSILSSKLGTSPEELKSNIKSGNLAQSLKNVSDGDIDKLTSILSNKDKAAKILSTPRAKELIKNLLKEKPNG